MTQVQQDIRIVGEPSENDPYTCTFTVDRPLHPGKTARFTSPVLAKRSPLAEKIFALGPVTAVIISDAKVVVTKRDDSPWEVIGKKIGAEIRAFLGSDEELLAPEEALAAGENGSLREKVQAVLDEMINPSVAMHGGYVTLVEAREDGVISIAMGGGCQGCGMSTMTLRMGIETTLREEIPEITEVLDVTDHSSGENPFYVKS